MPHLFYSFSQEMEKCSRKRVILKGREKEEQRKGGVQNPESKREHKEQESIL